MINPFSNMGRLLIRVFGSHNERSLKKLWPIVQKVNDLEPSMKSLSDEQLGAKTSEFRDRLAGGETLDQLLPEAYATVREASFRNLRTPAGGVPMRHFDGSTRRIAVLPNSNSVLGIVGSFMPPFKC